MGPISRRSVLILAGLFGLSALLVHARTEPPAARKSLTLAAALETIPGWTPLGPLPLDEQIVRALELDDYVNVGYAKGPQRVALYVGYYLTGGKVGAAHDPLVCFPGQGWRISDQRRLQLAVPGHPPLDASLLTAELGQHKELVLYWFQAYDTTNAGTFHQKLSLLWKKLRAQGQDNAFVRVTVPLADDNAESRQQVLKDFVAAFYPRLLDFVHDGNRSS
jgi:EpsI family protein